MVCGQKVVLVYELLNVVVILDGGFMVLYKLVGYSRSGFLLSNLDLRRCKQNQDRLVCNRTWLTLSHPF